MHLKIFREQQQKKSPLEIKNMTIGKKSPLETLADKAKETSPEVEQEDKDVEKIRGPTINSMHPGKKTEN